jgi:hypothetical protein
MRKLMTIDLSTTITGWAMFDMDAKQLLGFGIIKPSKKGLAKFSYPRKQLAIMRDLASQIEALIICERPEHLVVEEINYGTSRLGQKTLDGAHWIFLDRLMESDLIKVRYKDSDGPDGWRTRLGLRLSDMDKKLNAERKKINKKKARGTPDLPIINKKHLAARHVNEVLGLNFDVDANTGDADRVDAIGLGLAIIKEME